MQLPIVPCFDFLESERDVGSIVFDAVTLVAHHQVRPRVQQPLRRVGPLVFRHDAKHLIPQNQHTALRAASVSSGAVPQLQLRYTYIHMPVIHHTLTHVGRAGLVVEHIGPRPFVRRQPGAAQVVSVTQQPHTCAPQG